MVAMITGAISIILAIARLVIPLRQLFILSCIPNSNLFGVGAGCLSNTLTATLESTCLPNRQPPNKTRPHLPTPRNLRLTSYRPLHLLAYE